MAECKQQRGFEDQEDETRFQSGQASFILVVIRQIRETATVLSESNTTEEIDLAGNIVRMSRTLEFRYIYIYVKTKIVQCASKNIDKTQKKALTRTTRFILQLVSSVQAESSG